MDEDEARAEIAREMEAIENPVIVRRDCAFCHRERTRKDDNHAPECPYWIIGPGAQS